jgi:hypothetical protein
MDNRFIISLPDYASLADLLCCAKKVCCPVYLSLFPRSEERRSSEAVTGRVNYRPGLITIVPLTQKESKRTGDIFFGANRYRPANAHRVLILV